MAEILVGPALGTLFGQVMNVVVEESQNCLKFTESLPALLHTLNRLRPIINVLHEQNRVLGRGEEELRPLLSLLEDGKKLLLKCQRMSRFNFIARAYYDRKIKEFAVRLDQFFNTEVLIQCLRDLKETLIKTVEMHQSQTASSSHSSTTTFTGCRGENFAKTISPNRSKDRIEEGVSAVTITSEEWSFHAYCCGCGLVT